MTRSPGTGVEGRTRSGSEGVATAAPEADHRPVYARVLRLRHTRLARWQAVLLFDAVVVVGVLLALAEVATAWAPVVLPAVVALVAKAYDVVAGLAGPLPPRPGAGAGPHSVR